jgi:hypothetical protein
LPGSYVFDGDIVALDEAGRLIFKDLLFRRREPLYVAFDVLLPPAVLLTGGQFAMQRSTLLAKLIGPLFLAIALGMLLNQNTYWGMIDEVIRHPSPMGNMLIYLSGLLSMLGGLAVVNAHPFWTRLGLGGFLSFRGYWTET